MPLVNFSTNTEPYRCLLSIQFDDRFDQWNRFVYCVIASVCCYCYFSLSLYQYIPSFAFFRIHSVANAKSE